MLAPVASVERADGQGRTHERGLVNTGVLRAQKWPLQVRPERFGLGARTTISTARKMRKDLYTPDPVSLVMGSSGAIVFRDSRTQAHLAIRL